MANANPYIYFMTLFPLGACVGSFLNVVIYRLPNAQSLLYPASFCPRCRTPILPRDNLPIIGWIKLRGVSRCCGQKISFRYPAVEFLTAALWGIAGAAFALENFPATPAVAAGRLTVNLTLIAALVAIALIDFDWQIVPDELSLGGLTLALVASGLLPDLHADFGARYAAVNPRLVAVMAAIIGALVGAGVALSVSFIGALIAKKSLALAKQKYPELRGALGGGDLKLMAFFGAIFGATGAIIIFALGAVSGAIFGLCQKKFRGDSLVPFAPFLCIAALGWIFFAPQLRELAGFFRQF